MCKISGFFIFILLLFSCSIFDDLNRKMIDAALSKDQFLAIEFLKKGADPNAYDEKNNLYILSISILEGSKKLFDELVVRGADVNRPSLGFTPLNLSVGSMAYPCKLAFSKVLIQYGADVNKRGLGGESALANAVHYPEDDRCIHLLLNAGADVHIVDNKGGTILHYAILGGDLDIIRYLLQKGLNPMHTDKFGDSPIDLAKKIGLDSEILKALNSGVGGVLQPD